MASYKVYNKAKSKEDKIKSNKGMPIESKVIESNCDLSELRRPIHTSLGGLNQVIKVLEHCTTEFKDLLTQDCDVLLECRVCRSIYRSPVNYLSHKRTYCNEKYDISKHGYFMQTDFSKELLKLKKLREEYWETNKLTTRESEPRRVPLTKDLSAVLEVLTEQNGVSDEKQDLTFQNIPSVSNAVFQNSCREKSSDSMSVQVKELNFMKSQNNAILQSDGKFSFGSVNVITKQNETINENESRNKRDTKEVNVIQISDDEEEEPRNLRCNICQVQFLTSKTLKSHYKTQHDDNRLVFPCPDCDDLYSTSWSVYRHLCKVHRKTSTQVKKLRESIQAKAFRLNNPPASYEKRKNLKIASAQKLSEEERIERENQAWMDNMEGDNEIPRCGGCGRTFERRAALAAHTNTCQPRNRALSRRYAENKKVDMQIRKDYNKSSPSNATLAKSNDEENITNKECVEKMEFLEVCEPTQANECTANNILDKKNDQEESNVAGDEQIKYQFLETEEENINFNALKIKVQKDVDIETLKCNKCDTIQSDIHTLYKHMAEHLGWTRYGCKLCPFKNYMLSKLPTHIQDVHKLKGDNEFYFSTIKVLNPDEAIYSVDTSANTSPDSQRQSRLSSDSSKLSDVESCNNIRVDSNRKRKHMQRKNEQTPPKDDFESSGKQSEDNSETDDLEDKLYKKRLKVGKLISLGSSRPVRKRSKPKNDDFEYDLSNLLKMEAQGYRDTIPVSVPVPMVKKTTQVNNSNKNQKNKTQSFISNDGRNYSGALKNLTDQAVAKASAQISQVLNIPSQYYTPPVVKVKPQNIKVIPDLEKHNTSKKDEIKSQIDTEHTISNNDSVITSGTDLLEKVDANTQAGNSTECPEQLNNTENNKIIQTSVVSSTELNKATFTVPATGTIPITRDKFEVIKNNGQGASTIGNKVLVIKKSSNVNNSLPLSVQGIKLSKAITIGRKNNSKPLTFVKYSAQHIVKKMPKGMSIKKIVDNSVIVPSNSNNNTVSETSNTESN